MLLIFGVNFLVFERLQVITSSLFWRVDYSVCRIDGNSFKYFR